MAIGIACVCCAQNVYDIVQTMKYGGEYTRFRVATTHISKKRVCVPVCDYLYDIKRIRNHHNAIMVCTTTHADRQACRGRQGAIINLARESSALLYQTDVIGFSWDRGACVSEG